MPGLSGLAYRRLSQMYGASPGSSSFGYLTRQQKSGGGIGSYGYYDAPGSGILPGGLLRTSPSQSGQPRSMPGIDVPVPGQFVPNLTGLDYSNTLGLPKGPTVVLSEGGGLGAPPGVGPSNIGRNIPLNDWDVPPENNDFYYSGEARAPRALPVDDYPNLRDAPTVTPEGYIFPETRAAESPYPLPGGWNPRGSSFNPRTGLNWVDNATNTVPLDANGYPIPGGGTGPRAGNWATNASRPSMPWGFGPNYVDPRAANAAAFGLAAWNAGGWAPNPRSGEGYDLAGRQQGRHNIGALAARFGMAGIRGGRSGAGSGRMPGTFQ